MNHFSSAAYWDQRYRRGGTSGAGSYGHLAGFKAGFINGFMAANKVDSVIDLGCGDGNLLSMLSVPNYIGVDVSVSVLAQVARRFPRHRFMTFDALPGGADAVDIKADLALSVDVIFHLTEDDVFALYMDALFRHARQFILIYASNTDMAWTSPHVRHRRFSDHIAATQPDWLLAAHVPNRHAFDPARPDGTSFSDFFVYVRSDFGGPCHIDWHD